MYSKTTDTTIGSNKDLSAIVRAGCFASEEEALCEAVQMLFAVKPHLRVEAAIRRYLDEEITLGRAAELAGVTQWRLKELLAQRGIRITIEARPTKELDEAVERIRRRHAQRLNLPPSLNVGFVSQITKLRNLDRYGSNEMKNQICYVH